MTYGLIFDGRIVQTASAEFAVPDTMTWIDLTGHSPEPKENWSATLTGTSWSFSPPAIAVMPLPKQASAALSTARTYVYQNFSILNEATPSVWVTYLKALMAIANGADTTSTVLPAAPSS